MATKKLDGQQIRHCIQVLDALAQSGQSVKEFAQAQGMSHAQLRGWQMHGARWRAQQAPTPPSQQPAQVQSQVQAPQALVAKPALACDFVQAQVTPERANPNGASSAHGSANKPVVSAGAAMAATTPTAWGEPPPIELAYKPASQSKRRAHAHHPPNPGQVQIICTQGVRSAVVSWPAGAPLECAQWLKAYLA